MRSTGLDRNTLGAALGALTLLAWAPAAGAAEAADAAAPARPNPDGDAKGQKFQIELRGLRDTMGASDVSQKKLQADVESIQSDRAKLREALIETTRKIDAAGATITEGEKRLDTLTGSEQAIRRSLETRRGTLGEVLAALQRMGRAAPPALLVRPDDMLAAVHTAILLGAVLPEMRAEAQALADDLRDLVALRKSIGEERDGLARDLKSLEADRARLTLLTDARQKALGEAQGALDAERQRATDLAKQATSLENLIARMEAESASAQKAAEQARRADEARQQQAALESNEQQARIVASPFKDPARLAPALPFVQTKGHLPMPVSGPVVRAYGVSDGFGGTEKGLSIGARPSAPVASPTDGWVVYAAPYRSYGQLIIINAGGNYHIVLAGMEKISVAVGQFVLAGEPVGTMGNGAARTAAAIAIGSAQPVLYVEFRKDGSAIDPSPWWAQPDMQRVRG
jgi:septal ring factor EnvC (AmiA/AmiB activator)